MIESRIQRQRDQETLRLEKDRLRAEKDRRREKGKGKAKDDGGSGSGNGNIDGASPPTSPGKSSKKLGTSPNGGAAVGPSRARGFARLRSTLTSYLARTSPLTTTTSGDLIPLSISSLPSYLRYYYSTLDPIRLLSVVLFVFAVGNWLKARLAGGVGKKIAGNGFSIKDSLALVLSTVIGKVGETIKMGTAVTSL